MKNYTLTQNRTSFVARTSRFLVVTAATALLATGVAAQAQIVTFNTTGNLGTETTEPSVSNDPGIAPTNLTLGAGVTPAGNGNRFGGSAWFDAGDSNPTTLAESVTGNDYIQLTITPLAGFTFTPTDFTFIFDRSSTGPSAVTLRSSVDNFTADLGTATGLVSTQTTFTTLTIAGLTNVATATTFRLYGYGATAAAGTAGFDTTTGATSPNVLLNGTVDAVVGTPEPSTYVMLVGAAGLMGLVIRRKSVRA